MNKFRMFYSLLAILFGAFMVVYGERDDSPGGQFLGLISFIFGVWGILKSRKRNTD